MMNNKIFNSKVDVPKGISLNDKDYINCLLSNLKDMEKGYICAMTEASNEDLYDIYKTSLIAIADLQRVVYEIMFRKGWYILESVDTNKINDKYNLLLNEYNDLELES